ncbi:hypothetical protein [Salinibacterium sp. ZJ77]|uniref:hypothetical protein n=1 Tax=Salinibacterium sp. ZJ77 TaxID=2708337 RepID=UPI00141E235E|nr:hypothetical protein [Salinibacterium sp. ZJ77]
MNTRAPDPFDEDDEALQWAGDDVAGRDAPRLGGSLDSDPESDADASHEDLDDDADADAPARRDVPTLAVTAVFGVLYAAVTLGWILSVQLLGYPAIDLPGEIMWQFGEFLSLISAGVWFAAVLALTHEGMRRRALVRAGWLALGLGVLVPLPYLLGALG